MLTKKRKKILIFFSKAHFVLRQKRFSIQTIFLDVLLMLAFDYFGIQVYGFVELQMKFEICHLQDFKKCAKTHVNFNPKL